MTKEKMLKKLLRRGAVLWFRESNSLTTLARVMWLDKQKRIRWCGVFPQHQGHVHETPYDSVEVENDKALIFNAGEKSAFYIVPYDDNLLDPQRVKDTLDKWRSAMAVEGNEARFNTFFDEAL